MLAWWPHVGLVLSHALAEKQTRVSDLKGLTVVNQRKWAFLYERLINEVSLLVQLTSRFIHVCASMCRLVVF